MSIGYPVAGEAAHLLRWIAEPGTFAEAGEVLSFGVTAWPEWLASARVISGHELELQARDAWPQHTDELWSFMPAVMAEPSSWSVVSRSSSEPACSSDERLCAAVDAVLTGEFGEFVAGHGGSIEVQSIHDGIVKVKLAGSCSGCSLADVTVKLRLERDIRLAAGADFASLVAVRG